MKKKIFLTGGAGYVGSRVVPYLINLGYGVTVYDIMYFTDKFLPQNDQNLKIIQGDIRDTQKLKESCKGHDYFLHLACISNDASFILDKNLSKSVNFDCFEPMVLAAKENKIKRFIYASTSSVYGVSEKKNVTEDHPLVPLTDYNELKGLCEPILERHASEDFEVTTFRPATVCGYGPRLRLDLTVNILTNHAFFNNKILVFGGDQLRPNLHILDYCRVTKLLLEAEKSKIHKKIFNVGYQNKSVLEIANIVKKTVETYIGNKKNIELEIQSSNDNRSYHINSDKIKKELNFEPKHTIEEAIAELCDFFSKNNKLDTFNDNIYYNVKRLKDLS